MRPGTCPRTPTLADSFRRNVSASTREFISVVEAFGSSCYLRLLASRSLEFTVKPHFFYAGEKFKMRIYQNWPLDNLCILALYA